MFKKDDQIGTFTLIEKLGKGAFGEVWLAEEKTAISSHKFALKLPNEADVDLNAIRQEADVWENVKGHPNILPIIKADILGDQIYIASEYAPDGSLDEWLKRHGGKAPTIETGVELMQGILSGLAHLHSKGVIHRDLKPANILLQADTPRIADFGIARLAASEATAGGASTMSAGTPSYMAPECFQSVRSVQTDIWAVGVLFHKILTGLLPFSRPDQISVMNAIMNDEPNIEPSLPEALRNIIRKALQKDTALRYQTAAEMLADLNAYRFSATNAEEAKNAPAIPVANTPTVAAPVVIPLAEKEEVTVVRPKRKPRRIYIRRRSAEGIKEDAPDYFKTLAVALLVLLVAGAIIVIAVTQLRNDEPQNTNIRFSELSNQSNRNANSRIGTNSVDAYGNPPVNPSVQIPASTYNQVPASGVTTSVTPYQSQQSYPVETPVSNVNIQPRVSGDVPQTEATPITLGTPIGPRQTPTPRIIKTDSATPSSSISNPSAPRPTTQKTPKAEETPPPMPSKPDNDN